MTSELEARVEDLEARVDALEERMEAGIIPASGSDLDSFLDEVGPATHIERATAIGYYLTHEGGWESFDVSDVEEGYIKTRVPKPANLSDVLAGAEDRKWLMRCGTKGQTQLWTITRDGDVAVQSGFEP